MAPRWRPDHPGLTTAPSPRASPSGSLLPSGSDHLPPTKVTITHVFWSPTKARTIDAEHPTTGRGAYSGLTLQELNTREGVTLQRMTCEKACQLQTEADRARYCTGADEVTPERADDALNCLPPYRWTRTAGVAATSWEAFAIGEPLTDRLRTWFVRLGHRWFELIEDRAIDYADLIDAVKASPAFHRAEA